jgi:hypothetical protein
MAATGEGARVGVRYRAAPSVDAWFFDRCPYIGLNPVRARVVARPRLAMVELSRACFACPDPLVSEPPH